MSRLSEYDATIELCNTWRDEGHRLANAARLQEEQMLRDLGIYMASREPGFPCWTHRSLLSYMHNPRDVAIKLDQLKQEKANASARLSEERGSEASESATRILGEVSGRA